MTLEAIKQAGLYGSGAIILLMTLIHVKQNKADDDEQWASLSRTHILRFGDEILHGMSHSKEHFNQVLLDISKYEQYCESHPQYINNIATATIQQIKKTYQKCLDENNFL